MKLSSLSVKMNRLSNNAITMHVLAAYRPSLHVKLNLKNYVLQSFYSLSIHWRRRKARNLYAFNGQSTLAIFAHSKHCLSRLPSESQRLHNFTSSIRQSSPVQCIQGIMIMILLLIIIIVIHKCIGKSIEQYVQHKHIERQ